MSGRFPLVAGPTTPPESLDELRRLALRGRLGQDPTGLTVSVAFVTSQGARHPGRSRGYRNRVLSLRIGGAVGSCSVEPSAMSVDGDRLVDDCVGTSVGELLEHPVSAVRIAAMDAYLMHLHPHPNAGGRVGTPLVVPAGTSLTKSQARARSVVDLVPVAAGERVLVVGVVNSLLAQLRARGLDYLPCDLAGGRTEWGEPVRSDALEHLDECAALLVTGMVLGNDTFDALLAHARSTGQPMVMFAQSGSAVLPWFLGNPGLYAVSAEPYPFFSLDGGPSTVWRYRCAESA